MDTSGLVIGAVSACAVALCAAANAVAQSGAQSPPAQDRIRVGVELVTTTATVRDARGRFIATVAPHEFEIYEDGVKQSLVTFSLTQGGRTSLAGTHAAGVARHHPAGGSALVRR